MTVPEAGVHLVGLPTLYSHGLRHALLQSGLQQVSVTPVEQLTQSVPEQGRFVVVMPQDRIPMLPSSLRPDIARARCAVVELTDSVDDSGFLAAVRRGASGFVEMDGDPDTVVDAVRSAARGFFTLPTQVRRVLVQAEVQADAPALSEQEVQWLRGLGQGATVAALAHGSAYSEREMYRLLARVYQTLGADTRTQALLNAQRWGLLDERKS
ncbi:hypothetical protein GCM10022223_53950 [Kineosporia mesophila]|uniref:DNA-binding NarL/FixJ family response regulator n=1 Tax=Kineosporia mesophila TaxID=566012 RepID=A0ABP7ACZ0_9ACTN|nr:hypothetical protein [Kineosporia mesophila]MCD5351227.1 hypothetical protein [Kineosporia mesophila]